MAKESNITWGMPAQIAENKEIILRHRKCPSCGAEMDNGFHFFNDEDGFAAYCECGFKI